MKKIVGVVIIVVSIVLGFVLAMQLFPQGQDGEASEAANSKQASDIPSAPESEPQKEQPKVDPVQKAVDAMTLDEKIAQMLIVDKNNATISPEEQAQLQTAPYGGYILMAGAYGTLAQTRAFVEQLQNSAKTPLIITTDQEGGTVQRIQSITSPRATKIPNMYYVGQQNDEEYAETIGRVLAEELRAIGINVDLAPDADVFSNPNNTVIGRRSFSSNPDTVANLSAALARGLEQNGVAATYKHFPGHGDTAVDSHQSLPIIDRTREQLDESDLVPFRNAIDNGAQFIMVGHIAMPQITGDNTPATLSHTITTELLREELGFDGLIMTDGINMGALTKNYSEAEIYTKAVEAGADLLLMPQNPQLAMECIKAQIPETRINESVYRIMKFKQEQLADYEYLDASYFGSAEHAQAVAG